MNRSDPDDHQAHVEEHVRALLAAPPTLTRPARLAERVRWRLRHPFTATPRVDLTALLDAHVAYHVAMAREVSGVHPIQRGTP